MRFRLVSNVIVANAVNAEGNVETAAVVAVQDVAGTVRLVAEALAVTEGVVIVARVRQVLPAVPLSKLMRQRKRLSHLLKSRWLSRLLRHQSPRHFPNLQCSPTACEPC